MASQRAQTKNKFIFCSLVTPFGRLYRSHSRNSKTSMKSRKFMNCKLGILWVVISSRLNTFSCLLAGRCVLCKSSRINYSEAMKLISICHLLITTMMMLMSPKVGNVFPCDLSLPTGLKGEINIISDCRRVALVPSSGQRCCRLATKFSLHHAAASNCDGLSHRCDASACNRSEN